MSRAARYAERVEGQDMQRGPWQAPQLGPCLGIERVSTLV